MIFHILSDTHIEHWQHTTSLYDPSPEAEEKRAIRCMHANESNGWHPGIMIEDTDADAVILAGDIHTGTRGVEWAVIESKSIGKPIVYVLGNHEYYGHDLDLVEKCKDVAKGSDVHVLERDEVILGGCRILGCTLWTDYQADIETQQSDAMMEANIRLTDHRRIKNNGSPFTPQDAVKIHIESRDWLKEELSKQFDGQTIVVTHHGPSVRCQNYAYPVDALSGAFYSSLDELVKKTDLWVFGHTHSCLDVQIGNSRLVSNQRGYPRERVEGFSPRFCVDLGVNA